MASRICFRFQAPPVEPPEQLVVGIFLQRGGSTAASEAAPRFAGTCCCCRITRCIGFKLQPLATNSIRQVSPAVPDSWALAHAAEIVGRGDDAAAEMVMPDPVHHHARGQRICGSAIQRASAVRGCSAVFGQFRSSVGQQNAERPHADALALVLIIAARQHMDRVDFSASFDRNANGRTAAARAFSPARLRASLLQLLALSAASGMPRSFCISA